MMAGDLGLCLVTGAGGFVGRALVNELLAQQCRVRILSRHDNGGLVGCEYVKGEWVADPGTYDAALQGVDTVFHLAGIAHAKAAAQDYEYNAEVSLALAKQASIRGVKRFVYVSSTKAMGDPGSGIGSEDNATRPDEPYGQWKRITEQRLLEEMQIPHVAILRPCLIYGAGVKGNLYSMMRAIDRGFFPPLPDTGSVRSMVSVKDVARALITLASHADANRKIFIASDEQAYTAHSIYVAMRRALGKPDSHWYVPVMLLQALGRCGDLLARLWKGFPVNSGAIHRLTGPAMYSSARLRSLGWSPSTSFEQELPIMVEAYRKGAG